MEFSDQIKQFAKRVQAIKDTVLTEEATKTAIIMPFFAMLGYDVFNPQEFVPEFVADVGIKKGEKVDYAIMRDGQPSILIECKSITEKLEKHDSQLFRYFGTSTAKFAILTNGLSYRFYTDLDNSNKMDSAPFLSVDILSVKDSQLPQLQKFCKSEFDVDSIFSAASELRYLSEFKTTLSTELENPSDDFVRFFLQSCYSAPKTQIVIERFRPLVKKALAEYINENMKEKIKTALDAESGSNPSVTSSPAPTAEIPAESVPDAENKIFTTEEELEAYFIVKTILSDVVPFQDLSYKDTESYMGVLYKGNRNKWVCRFQLGETKSLLLPTADKKKERINIESIYDIFNFSDKLHEAVKRYL